MLIGIDASRANEEKKTGVGWYAYHVIQELKHLTTQPLDHSTTSQSLRVVLYTNKPLQGELANLPDGWTEKVLNWFPGKLWTQVRLSWEMLINPPDVLFIPAHVFPIIHPKKTVMTVHDIAAIKFPESYNWFERWYTLWSAKFAVKHLWRVITPSRFTKEEITTSLHHRVTTSLHHYITTSPDHYITTSQDKIKVVAHGYNEEYKNLEVNKKEILEKLNKYKINKPYLLSVGRLEEKKNTVNIIKAFEKVRLRLTTYDLKLVLVGGEGCGYEKVREAINNSQFKNDIITPGWVDNDDLPYLMNGAEVFVFPSLYEGFGLPVLEAMACGTPVLTARGSSLEEVGGEACLYVDPQNVDEIVDGILKFQNVDFRTQIIEKGLENVKRFSWSKCAKETLNCLIT